jgi:HprK-related kinase A
MRLGDLKRSELVGRALAHGLRYRTGSFIVCLHSDVPEFLAALANIYAPLELLGDDEPCHYNVSMRRQSGLRRWARPQIQFTVDGLQPFEPYPLGHAFPMYEWGLNWCIGTTAHYHLLLHSAVVEKQGRGVILPAIPGSGKSTLCAGLVSRGWRLLSDEFGVIRHGDGMVQPLPRAAPLKNESIQIIRDFAPELKLGPLFERTRKGTIAHMAPPTDSLLRQGEAVSPRWVIFPTYRVGEPIALRRQSRAVALARLVNNSFNYPVTMADGFRTLVHMVRHVDCYELVNGDLGEAVAAIEGLLEGELK